MLAVVREAQKPRPAIYLANRGFKVANIPLVSKPAPSFAVPSVTIRW